MLMVGTNRSHERLEVWQEAMNLVVLVYEFTRTFPQREQYALASQMQRASVSIPSNIAEGAARNGGKKFLHFLSIARRSLAELETQIQIAQRIGYLESSGALLRQGNNLVIKLSTLMRTVKSKNAGTS